MRLLLTSAGLRNDALASELKKLVGQKLKDTSIIHIPTAANTELGDKRWVLDDLNNLARYNFKSIDILDIRAVTKEVAYARMSDADVISFGGGNEQYLAKVFAEYEMSTFLKDALLTRVYMGTSAGSMVLGEYLSPYEQNIVYPEEDFHTELHKPLRFYNFAFIPHLNSEWFTHVRIDVLDSIKNTLHSPAYATDDETALSVVDGVVSVVGTGAHWYSA
jgi:dipeptidase E